MRVPATPAQRRRYWWMDAGQALIWAVAACCWAAAGNWPAAVLAAALAVRSVMDIGRLLNMFQWGHSRGVIAGIDFVRYGIETPGLDEPHPADTDTRLDELLRRARES